MPKQMSDEEYLLAATNAHNKNARIQNAKDLIESKREGDLIKYAKDKYIIPLKLKNTDKSKEFIKSVENKSITTNKQIDDFFNKKSKTDKSKTTENIKEAIKDIKKNIIYYNINMVEVMTKKEADRRRKIAIEASKKIRESMLKAVEKAKKQEVIDDKERVNKDKLMDYNESLIKDEHIWKKINGMIYKGELSSKSDIDKYIKSNNLLKCTT